MPPVQILVNDANSKKVLKIDNIKSFTGVRAIKKSKGKKLGTCPVKNLTKGTFIYYVIKRVNDCAIT